jgi:tetratricopeptide (TPR) repeat protein
MAYVLKAICLRNLGRRGEAMKVLDDLLEVDPLDHWAHAERSMLAGDGAKLAASSRNDAQTALDIAFDYADCGCWREAIELLQTHASTEVTEVAVPNPLQRTVMADYSLAWLYAMQGDATASSERLASAREASPDYCFPSRLFEMVVLEWAVQQPGSDLVANYGLGNFYYDKKRHTDAVNAWETACGADEEFATVHRNLGIAYWNISRDGGAARAAYEKALACAPEDARLVAEYVQLCGKLGDPAESRLAFLESHRALVAERDDASVELATLYNETGHPEKALDLLGSRRFHPWEGGEGKVLRQYTTARIELGQRALKNSKADDALEQFERAYRMPDDLGEKYHLLQAKADLRYWQGRALRALGREAEAIKAFEEAANESGDFQGMAVTEFSELTIFKALALRELGREAEANGVFSALAGYCEREMKVPAKIDYFATSLPNLLVFEENLDLAKRTELQRLLKVAKALRKRACSDYFCSAG